MQKTIICILAAFALNCIFCIPSSAQFRQTVYGAKMQGRSEEEGQIMASMTAKGKVQVQATISAVKEMAGWTFYACVFSMIFVLVIRYPKRKLLT